MVASAVLPRSTRPGDYVPDADQRLVLHGVPWEHFEVQLALRGERPVPRMAYLEGALELMSPSRDHERIKSWIGRLLETFAEERGFEAAPYGSWTLKHAPEAAGAEPDECYIIGADQAKDRPDLAIEVVWTSGGIDKLEIYRRLGVPEVWIWIDGRLDVYVLRGAAYARVTQSAALPDLDLAVLLACLAAPSLLEAKRALRAALAR